MPVLAPFSQSLATFEMSALLKRHCERKEGPLVAILCLGIESPGSHFRD